MTFKNIYTYHYFFEFLFLISFPLLITDLYCFYHYSSNLFQYNVEKHEAFSYIFGFYSSIIGFFFFLGLIVFSFDQRDIYSMSRMILFDKKEIKTKLPRLFYLRHKMLVHVFVESSSGANTQDMLPLLYDQENAMEFEFLDKNGNALDIEKTIHFNNLSGISIIPKKRLDCFKIKYFVIKPKTGLGMISIGLSKGRD